MEARVRDAVKRNTALMNRRYPMDKEQIARLFADSSDQMTDDERGAAYAAGQKVDHIPYSLLGNEEAFADLYGYMTAQWRDDPKAHIDIIRRRREEFGISSLGASPTLRTVGASVGSKLLYPEVGIDRVVDHAIHDISEVSKVLDIDPYTSPVYLRILERGRILKDAFPEMGIGTSVTGPLSSAANVMPIEKLLRGTVKHPSAIRELLDMAEYHATAWIKMFAKEFGPSGCLVADPVACAGIVSRKQFTEFAKPALNSLITSVTDIMGIAPSLHICGKTSPLWEDMLDMKISAFSVDNCESLQGAKECLGGTFPLMGNVAPVDTMLNGTIDDVIENVKDCLHTGADSARGYTLDTGCQVPIGTPRENFQAYIHAARIYGRGAKLGCLPEGLDNERRGQESELIAQGC